MIRSYDYKTVTDDIVEKDIKSTKDSKIKISKYQTHKQLTIYNV